MDLNQILEERKKQLNRISKIRGRDILVYAGDSAKNAPVYIDYTDILAFSDQLKNLSGKKLDIIIETPGGYAEVVEDLVKMIRDKFNDVSVIIPGSAKSAGTIFAMSADEILMGNTSSLGPIDAQIMANGKKLSAGAFLKDLKKIKQEASEEGHLNPAYVPIMEKISLGEIEQCENAQNFSKKLVSDWLAAYCLKEWTYDETARKQVTDTERYDRASEIAEVLCDHSRWLTHSRSIKIDDLRKMKLTVTDYRENPDLDDAITRYYNLLRMSFDGPVYKICETKTSQIYRIMPIAPQQGPQNLVHPQDSLNKQAPNIPKNAIIDFECLKCKNRYKIQANFERGLGYEEGMIPYPTKDNISVCPVCGNKNDLTAARRQIEAQTKRTIK